MATDPSRPSVNQPKPTRLHYAWSCLLIFLWLTFAGLMAVWFFNPVPLYKIVASGLTSGSLLMALLQYLSTFRYHREATVVTMCLSGLLCVVLFISIFSLLLRAVETHTHGPSLQLIVLLAIQVLMITMFCANAYRHLTWGDQLQQAKQSNTLPVAPKFITLREVFLLMLAISWVLGITSFCLRSGWQAILLF